MNCALDIARRAFGPQVTISTPGHLDRRSQCIGRLATNIRMSFRRSSWYRDPEAYDDISNRPLSHLILLRDSLFLEEVYDSQGAVL